MARDRVSIDQFPGAVMAQLEEYVSMASDDVKEAVRTVSEDVKAEIQSRAPVKTGKYKASWTVTKVEETAQSLVNTVHSAKHYRLTHLLENGHAKRGGGRTRAFPHIAPERLGFPFAYDHFAEGEGPDPPFLVYRYLNADNFAADGVAYFKQDVLHIEVYTDKKDPALEERIEAVLDESVIFYGKGETWIDSEKLYEVLYEMEVSA